MIYLSATSLLNELRSIRTALEDHNTHLGVSLPTLAAWETTCAMIKKVENASYLQNLDPAWTDEEAGLGSSERRDRGSFGG